MNKDEANQRCGFHHLDISAAEILLYNMCHVKHHAAQLNFVLSSKLGSVSSWVRKTEHKLE